MQLSKVVSYLNCRAERFISGDLDSVADHYVFPTPVFLRATRAILRDRADCVATLSRHRAALLARGTVALVPKVTAIDLPRAGRFRVWVDWKEQRALGQEVRGASVIYYCRSSVQGLEIEMMQYTRITPVELRPTFAALPLSA